MQEQIFVVYLRISLFMVRHYILTVWCCFVLTILSPHIFIASPMHIMGNTLAGVAYGKYDKYVFK